MKQYLLRHKVASLVVVLLSFLENASSIISISLNAKMFLRTFHGLQAI